MLKWAGCLLLAAGLAPMADAQTWPTHPVRLIVGFSAGSATDISARLLAPKLTDMWGQPVVIENRSGAGSSIASTMAAQATPCWRFCPASAVMPPTR